MRTALIGFIWAVTAIDIWCCQWLTPDAEMNPIALWLLVHSGVWTLVAVKVFGTWIVTEWLRHLRFFYTLIVAGVMAMLLMILTGVIPI